MKILSSSQKVSNPVRMGDSQRNLTSKTRGKGYFMIPLTKR